MGLIQADVPGIGRVKIITIPGFDPSAETHIFDGVDGSLDKTKCGRSVEPWYAKTDPGLATCEKCRRAHVSPPQKGHELCQESQT